MSGTKHPIYGDDGLAGLGQSRPTPTHRDAEMTFELTIEQFKQGVAEFTKSAPTCDRDSLENGWKAVGLMYLGMRPDAKSDIPIAVSYLEYAGRRYMDRDIELMSSNS